MVQFIARKNHRFRRLVPVRYLGVWMAGEGLIEDLSLSGGHINGNASVSPGMPLALQIFVPGDPNLLRVDRAIVKWVKGLNFGVEFDEPEPKVADRISLTISRLAQTEHGVFRNG